MIEQHPHLIEIGRLKVGEEVVRDRAATGNCHENTGALAYGEASHCRENLHRLARDISSRAQDGGESLLGGKPIPGPIALLDDVVQEALGNELVLGSIRPGPRRVVTDCAFVHRWASLWVWAFTCTVRQIGGRGSRPRTS